MKKISPFQKEFVANLAIQKALTWDISKSAPPWHGAKKAERSQESAKSEF
uniref:Uncharacterized protein n=1 Tax=Anguilla anguilla TaxID=7936 RepID=A0A0E9VT91_ANGAN